jgi:hypothetical protein
MRNSRRRYLHPRRAICLMRRFVNRTYGESSFNTFTVGAKIRFTGLDNPIGVGVIPFYRFYADKVDEASGFNQLQRGSGAGGGGYNPFGGNRGDIGAILFADADLQPG